MERTELTEPDRPESGYLFEGYRLGSDGGLFRGDAALELTYSELRVLRALVVHAGHVVTHAQLRHAATKSDTRIEIPEVIAALKKHLGIDHCIEEIYRRGYRFRCAVKPLGTEPARATRLAILPVIAVTGVPPYLAEALTEEMGRQLRSASAGAVIVLEQDSVSTLAARGASPAEMNAVMQADVVMESSLRALPGRFRLRVEMLRGEDGASLWGEDVMVPEEGMPSLAAETANRISLRLGGDVSIAASSEESKETYPQDAFELLWRARGEWKGMQRHQMQDGLQRLQRAVDLAPHWVKARVELMNLCVHQAIFGFVAPQLAANIIRQSGGEALDKRAEALLPSLGWVYFHVDRNLRAADTAFKRSAHLPHDRWITRARTMYSLSRHRFNEAIEMIEKCIGLDPYSAGLHARLAWALHLAGEAEESVKRIDFALREFPEHELAKLYATPILANNGQVVRALAISEKLMQQRPYLDPALSMHAYALACAGEVKEARSLLEQLEWLGRERFVLRAFNPAVHVVLGDQDAAMEELQACNRAQCPWFFQTLADPRLKPLRNREDFKELMAILTTMEVELEADFPQTQ